MRLKTEGQGMLLLCSEEEGDCCCSSKRMGSHRIPLAGLDGWRDGWMDGKSFTTTTSFTILVWTPCLMHRCVCIWRYILQNYNYKLHFQNLSIYHILHVSKESVCSSFYWASDCCRRAAKVAKALPCYAMNACILTRSQVTGWNPLEGLTKSSCGKLRLGGTLSASNSRKG
jgi:hypothetical protein